MNHKWLEQLRKDKNMTQEQVAELIGIDRSYYTKIESGLVPSVKVAKNISTLFGFDWTVFFDTNCAKSEQKEQEVS